MHKTLPLLVLLLTGSALSAQDPDFALHHRALSGLETHCFDCHGPSSTIKAGLRVTSREDLLRGGERGSAVDLEDPGRSLLLINESAWYRALLQIYHAIATRILVNRATCEQAW